MTEEFTVEDDDVEQMYDSPEYRDVDGNDDFLEGAVGGFVEHGEPCGDCLKYGDYCVPTERVDSLDDHDAEARVQIHTVECDDDE